MFSNIDPNSPEGQLIVKYHFLTQVAPEIWYKLQKLALGPETWVTEIPKAAPSVHYNKEMEAEEKNRETKVQTQKAGSASFLRRGKPQGICWKPLSLLETWPLELKPKAPCAKCKEPGPWVCDCPGSRRGHGPEPLITLD